MHVVEENMAADMGFLPPFTALEGGFSRNDAVTVGDNSLENANNLKQMSHGKPPRHLSVVRHCVSSTRLSADLEIVLREGLSSTRRMSTFASTIWKSILLQPWMSLLLVLSTECLTDMVAKMQTLLLENFIIEDPHFPSCVESAVKSAFLRADNAFADDSLSGIASGTTALTILIFGRTLLVANVGDCRAVLGKRGRAVELSNDHKPNCRSERQRIESLGGVIYDGYLNGQLSVARALGDWHMKGPKGSMYPLSSELELQEILLTEEDEFLIMKCDGLWDVMTSQCAVSIVRKELMLHNDPDRCSRELVREALKLNTCDNLTVIVVCFSADPPSHLEILQPRFRRSISAEGLNFLKGVMESNA